MRTMASFIFISLDGFYEGPNGELDWPNVDAEFNDFAVRQLDEADTLGFGRAGRCPRRTPNHDLPDRARPGAIPFEDLKNRVSLTFLRVRQFDSGNILLTYRPSPQP
jgi:hypothetical protein